MATTITKICKKCGQEKELSLFPKRENTIDGYRHVCKSCRKLQHDPIKNKMTRKQYVQKNRVYLREWHKEWNKRKKIEVMEHYGGVQCSCCGEKNIEFLCIDHIEGGGTKHRKAMGNMGRQFWYWLKLQGYPEGYRVLCHNCNMSLGFYGYCPHKRLICM